MIDRNRTLAAGLIAAAALTAPVAASAQPVGPRPVPSYAHAYARDPFPYARPVAVARVRYPRYHGPAYAYGYPYPAYPYGYYPYPAYGYYPGWYGPRVSVGIGFRFGGGYARIGGRWR